MSLAIAVTASPRPTDTLQRSIESLVAHGGKADIISVNHDVLPFDPGFPVVRHPVPLATCRHWAWALKWLLTETSADWLLVCQDDVLWLQTASGVLDGDLLGGTALSQVGCLTLHAFGSTMKSITEATGDVTAEGWYPVPPDALLSGAQALILPRVFATTLMMDKTFLETIAQHERHIDHHVHRAVTRFGLQTYLLHPRVISHEMGGIKSNRAYRVRHGARTHRDLMANLASTYGWRKGAELGLGHGHLARRFLQTRTGLHLIGVDTMGVPERKASLERIRTQYGQRAEFHQMRTAEAAALVPDQSLDFVFVDAGHGYGNVAEDISLWRSKVKPGGWFGGHDYSPQFPGVVHAVREAFGDAVDLLPFDVWRARGV